LLRHIPSNDDSIIIIIIMKSYMKYTIKTHKIDNKNIDKLEFKKTHKTLEHVKHHDMLKYTIKSPMSLCKKQTGNLRLPSRTKRHSDNKLATVH